MDFGDLIDVFSGLNAGWARRSSHNMESREILIGTPLEIAVRRGDRQAVKMLLERGESCNSKDDYDRSLLLWATLRGHDKIAKDLIHAGCDVNMCDKEMNSPLHFATFLNFNGILQTLVHANANLHKKNENGFTALHFAAQYGNAIGADVLISAGAKLESKTKDNATPLHLAVTNKQLAVFNILVDKGADVNAAGGADSEDPALLYATPLLIAVNNKLPICTIKKLIFKSADVNARNASRYSALHIAVANNDSAELVEYLLENGAESTARDTQGFTALHYLTTNQRIRFEARLKIAKILVRYGVDVAAVDYIRGWTPLHWASYFNDSNLVTFFLEDCKADANTGGPDRPTPLHVAVGKVAYESKGITYKSRKLVIIKALIKHGANTEAKDEQERTPFYIAAEHADVNVCRFLLISGSCYDSRADTVTRQLPIEAATLNPDRNVKQLISLVIQFFKAVRKNDLDEIKKMIGKDTFLVHCCSAQYRTSLHYSSWKGFTEMTELLLVSGADPNSTNKLYSSPLHYAVKFNNPKIVDALLSRGAIYDAVCPYNGKTPKITAQEAKNVTSLLVLSKIEQLFASVISGDVDVIRQLDRFKSKDKKAFMVIQGAKNNLGKRLIDEALDHNHSKIANYLASAEGHV